MCTYSQLKNKIIINFVSMAPLMSQNCTRPAKKISQNVLNVEA